MRRLIRTSVFVVLIFSLFSRYCHNAFVGEIAKLVQVARGVDDSGTLQADIIVSGNLPEFPVSAKIVLEPYIEDYIQTGPRMSTLSRIIGC